MGRCCETDLYAPVKAFLEARGLEVKGEIGAADVLARGPGGEVVIVELKAGFSLSLLQQAVARQAICEDVYVAVPRWSGKAGWRAFKGNLGLCRRLGLGVLSVDLAAGAARLHCAPAPFRPRRVPRKRAALISEFDRREGDPNAGGMTRRGLVTSYRQEAVRCARVLSAQGPSRGAEVARAAGVARATRMMADNHDGWFLRIERGVYTLSEAGARALAAAEADAAALADAGADETRWNAARRAG